MTDKLHCPYCGYELRLCDTFPSGSPQEHYECTNEKCKHGYEVMHKSTWKDLNDGKKAQDALKIVDGKLKIIANDENPSPIQSQALDCYIQIAKDCRDTITSITKRE